MSVEATLVEAGMRPGEAARKAALAERARAALGSADPRRETPIGVYVPGRIEVLGKHTDYAGGRSLLCAAERGFIALAVARTDPVVRVTDAGWGVRCEFALAPDLDVPSGGWANYPMTVARRIARNFPDARWGADIALASDLPPSSGMSSSSALITAIYLVLAEVNGLAAQPAFAGSIRTREALAGYLGTIENGQSFGRLAGDRGVGTFGGSEDHTAILACRPGALSQYRFCPVRHEATVMLPEAWTLVIAVSGVVASKTGAAREVYNRAAHATARILDLWRAASGRADSTLAEAAESDGEAPSRIVEALRHSTDPAFSADRLVGRFRQFWAEHSRIVPEVCRLIGEQRVEAIGPLVEESQRGAEEGLENQVPETIALVRLARGLGAVTASAFGAGFGGAVWALVAAEEAGRFAADWRSAFERSFPGPARRAAFFDTRPGPPATSLAGVQV